MSLFVHYLLNCTDREETLAVSLIISANALDLSGSLCFFYFTADFLQCAFLRHDYVTVKRRYLL